MLVGVMDKYTKVKDIITNCRIRVDDPQQYFVGEQVVIMQMKGADLNKQNNSSFGDVSSIRPAGLFEFNYIDSIFGDTIDLIYKLKSPDGVECGEEQHQLNRRTEFENLAF